MSNNSLDTSFKNETPRIWYDILREFNNLDVELLVFDDATSENKHWTILIDPLSENKKKKYIDYSFYHKRLNIGLKHGFSKSENLSTSYWEDLFSEYRFSGFCLPLDNTFNIAPDLLRSHLYFYQVLTQKFPFQNLLSSLSKKNKIIANEEEFAPYVVWYYIYFYAKFLHQLKDESYEEYKAYSGWYTHLLDKENFHCRLPSEQLTILLLHRCESLVADTDHQWQNKRLYARGIKEIHKFFNNYEAVLKQFLGDPTVDFTVAPLAESFEKIAKAIAALFLMDYDILLLQDAFDDQSKLRLSSAFSRSMKLRYGPKGLYNVTSIVKDKITRADERLVGQFKEDDPQLPRYKRPKLKLYPQNVQYWFDLVPEQRSELIHIIKADKDQIFLGKIQEAITRRCHTHWLNVLNEICAPFFLWEMKGKQCLPRWNLFEDNMTVSLKGLYQSRAEKKDHEKNLLEQHLEKVRGFDFAVQISNYKINRKLSFSYHAFHEQLQSELERKELIIKQRDLFYKSRMEEFGISDLEASFRIKRIWLKEMLQIEEEVKPFITYVKKAFQAALPIRKQISFSSDRHVNDGVEFDADTLFNHEKWMRADVMKAMESKTLIGEAIQINTFCLDYSGSMRHDRMRNLFKVLYLLVLGLEDRKSIDAFHFFSDAFLDGVDFSNEFTNRKVLFKILRKIAKINLSIVSYSGFGGTNISDGIKVSHEKMKTFVESFRKANPIANIVISIFVITDGEPSLGITDSALLNEFIAAKRKEGDVEIKGIFIKSAKDEQADVLKNIFGENHFVETSNFEEAVNKFVRIMTETYVQQREQYKWIKKKLKLGLKD